MAGEKVLLELYSSDDGSAPRKVSETRPAWLCKLLARDRSISPAQGKSVSWNIRRRHGNRSGRRRAAAAGGASRIVLWPLENEVTVGVVIAEVQQQK